MYTKPSYSHHASMFFSLEDTLNPRHPLYQLVHKIDWQLFEDAFSPLYCADNGRPAKPVRLILQESIRVNDDHEEESGGTVYIDSTVQEKNVTFLTDAKLLKKEVKNSIKISRKHSLPLRQSYVRILKQVCLDQRFRTNPRNRRKAARADRRLRTIAGRLVRVLERNLSERQIAGYGGQLSVFYRVLSQRRDSKDKIYSLHEPEVECICKGKEHKKYEFGNKVSIARTEGGLIVGAVSFRREHDSKTVDATWPRWSGTRAGCQVRPRVTAGTGGLGSDGCTDTGTRDAGRSRTPTTGAGRSTTCSATGRP